MAACLYLRCRLCGVASCMLFTLLSVDHSGANRFTRRVSWCDHVCVIFLPVGSNAEVRTALHSLIVCVVAYLESMWSTAVALLCCGLSIVPYEGSMFLAASICCLLLVSAATKLPAVHVPLVYCVSALSHCCWQSHELGFRAWHHRVPAACDSSCRVCCLLCSAVSGTR
jgi:hypothetical protein